MPWYEATVVMTDIVRSTSLAADLGGDEFAASLRDEHDATARAIAGQHGGRYVKSTGDGVLLEFHSGTLVR
jgi:class 3 adenylate cyclase